jgi:hypothetical protein
MQQRQMLALLQAHGLAVQLQADQAANMPAEISDLAYWMRYHAAQVASEYRALIDPQYGLLACELFDANERSIGFAYPLSESGAQALKLRLADLKRGPAQIVRAPGAAP